MIDVFFFKCARNREVCQRSADLEDDGPLKGSTVERECYRWKPQRVLSHSPAMEELWIRLHPQATESNDLRTELGMFPQLESWCWCQKDENC